MSRQKNQHIASFRGFQFLVESESTPRGKKLALHEYPNSDDRDAEPLGKIPPIFGLVCIIHGEDYFQKRADFERLLEIEGLGELVHPFYGAVQVESGPFTTTANQRKIGQFIVNATFYSSVGGIGPTALPATPETITKLADQVREDLDNSLEEIYEDPVDGTDLDEAVEAEESVLDSIVAAVTEAVGAAQADIAAVQSSINEFKSKVRRIMQAAASLKNAVKNLYNGFLQLTLLPGQLLASWEGLMDFGLGSDGSPVIGAINTVRRSRNETNKSATAEHTRLMGLAGYSEALAYIDFATDDDLNNAVALMDERFNQYFQENEQDVPSLAADQDVRASMLLLRATVRQALDAQLSNIWRVRDFNPGKSSMALTAYRIYGNLDSLDNIIDLNPGVNVANFNKEIKVVTK